MRKKAKKIKKTGKNVYRDIAIIKKIWYNKIGNREKYVIFYIKTGILLVFTHLNFFGGDENEQGDSKMV